MRTLGFGEPSGEQAIRRIGAKPCSEAESISLRQVDSFRGHVGKLARGHGDTGNYKCIGWGRRSVAVRDPP